MLGRGERVEHCFTYRIVAADPGKRDAGANPAVESSGDAAGRQGIVAGRGVADGEPAIARHRLK